jgi:hypothetical protein
VPTGCSAYFNNNDGAKINKKAGSAKLPAIFLVDGIPPGHLLDILIPLGVVALGAACSRVFKRKVTTITGCLQQFCSFSIQVYATNTTILRQSFFSPQNLSYGQKKSFLRGKLSCVRGCD